MKESSINRRREGNLDIAGAIILAVSSFVMYSFILLPISDFPGYSILLNVVMLVNIIYGIVYTILNIKKCDKIVLLLIIMSITARAISYHINGIRHILGDSFTLHCYYLVGISSGLYGKRNSLCIVSGSFFAFDIAAILWNTYNKACNPDIVSILLEKHPGEWILPETNLFINPNYAGMMAGAAIVLALIVVLGDHQIAIKAMMIPVFLLNAELLKVSVCRSAKTAIILVLLVTALLKARKKIKMKYTVCIVLIICTLTLIPLYALVYSGNNEMELDNKSTAEQMLEKLSSGRYSIWKATILSLEGKQLLGYGSSNEAVQGRKQFIHDSIQKMPVSDRYKELEGKTLSPHNGFLSMISETGVIGLILFLLIVFYKIIKMSPYQIEYEHKWSYLMLIYIFWINLFESKFITRNFFTAYLLMALLISIQSRKPIRVKVDRNQNEEKATI